MRCKKGHTRATEFADETYACGTTFSDNEMPIVVKELIEHNKGHLKGLYDIQMDLSNFCREEGCTCAERVAEVIARETTQVRTGPSHKALVFDAYVGLLRAVGRLSGVKIASPIDFVPPAKLRDLVARAESPAFVRECAVHLADLDRISTNIGSGLTRFSFSVRALAAREAAVLRDAAEKKELNGLLKKARAVLDSEGQPKTESPTGGQPRQPTATVAEVFEMGYIGPLWLGIEKALPRGVERMSEDMERASVPDWVARKTR